LRQFLLYQAPGIPEQQFHLVLGGHIAQQPAADEPPSHRGHITGINFWESLLRDAVVQDFFIGEIVEEQALHDTAEALGSGIGLC
jgi:hypothetical protein